MSQGGVVVIVDVVVVMVVVVVAMIVVEMRWVNKLKTSTVGYCRRTYV